MDNPDNNNFSSFQFQDSINEGLHTMGFKNPTPIQLQAIPQILAKKDIIACAQTGTGKTAAYILPILQHILENQERHLNTLIIAPTRELVIQIDQQIEGMGYFCNVSSIAIYGGGDAVSFGNQQRALEGGVDIICATPGRFIALLQTGNFNFSKLEHLVLDEADRMMDMGFIDDIMRIIQKLPIERQTLLFSATMPPKIRQLAGKILKNPIEINISISKPAEGIEQQVYYVFDGQKEKLLTSILSNEAYSSIIIFCSTKEGAKKLERQIRNLNFKTKAFHSDLEQAEREELLRDFKSKRLRILVGTDVLSRGIDVEGISLVINYDAPPDPEDYVHRIGRTARAATTGTAITFINQRDYRKLQRIEALIGKEIKKMELPEEIGKSPDFVSELQNQTPHKPSSNLKKKKFFRKNNSGNGKNQA